MDNTPPVISASLNPDPVKPGEKIKITAEASADTESVSAVFDNEKTDLTYSNGEWTGEYTVSAEAAYGTKSMNLETSDHVGNKDVTTASYEVADTTSNALNPENNQDGSVTNPNDSQGGSTSSGGSQTGTTTGGSNSGSRSGSSTGSSSGSNSGGKEELPRPNIPPNDSPDYTFYDFLKELVLCFYEIWEILAIVFSFFLFTAIICGIVFPEILIVIGLALIVCLGILLVWWAIQKIFEGLFKPRNPGG